MFTPESNDGRFSSSTEEIEQNILPLNGNRIFPRQISLPPAEYDPVSIDSSMTREGFEFIHSRFFLYPFSHRTWFNYLFGLHNGLSFQYTSKREDDDDDGWPWLDGPK